MHCMCCPASDAGHWATLWSFRVYIQGDSLSRVPKLLSIKNYVNLLTDDELTTGYYQKTVQHVTFQMLACEKLKVFSRQNYLKKPLATQISRSNACRLLSLGPIEGQSVQKYNPHNRTTQRRYTPRDSSRQRRHFGKSIPEFGETHLIVLGCERRPV